MDKLNEKTNKYNKKLEIDAIMDIKFRIFKYK